MQATASGRRAYLREIFAPVSIGLVPRHPDTSLAIHGHRRVELRRWLGGDRDNIARFAAVERAQVHVVVAGGIAIPRNPSDALSVERHGRLPIVAIAHRDLRFRSPRALRVSPRVDV